MGMETGRGYDPASAVAAETQAHGGVKRFDQSASGQFDRKVRELEKLMLFDELPGRQAAPRGQERTALEDRLLADLRSARVEVGKPAEGGEPDFFEALRHHEALNQYYGAFESSLGAVKDSDGSRKPSLELTPADVAAAYAKFNNRADLEKEEETVIRHYQASLREGWKLDKTDSTDGKVLLNDLLYRQAVRMADPAKRQAAIAELDRDMRGVIDWLKYAASTPEEQRKNVGRRAEYQTMLLMRHWAAQNKLEHLVRLEHTLPRDDQKFGIDFVLWVGDQQYRLDQKVLSPDEYQREFQEAKLSGARDKAALTRGSVIVIDSDRLRQAYQDDLEGKKGRGLRHVLERICATLKPEHSAIFGQAKEAPKEKDKAKPATPRELGEIFNVARLVEFGALAAADRNDPKKILEAKAAAIEAAKKAKVSPADLDSPEGRDKIKRAVSGS